MERVRDIGEDPLTWSFVKLFGVQLARDLQPFEGLPASHAWQWKDKGLWRARLLTKTQCTGILVSVLQRSERVEFMVDDGTALIKVVLWSQSASTYPDISLGDLVHVEGKLNMDMDWNAAQGSREIRALRISKVEDPNEEPLYWVQTLELTNKYYATTPRIHHEPNELQNDGSRRAEWEVLAAEAFFDLNISPDIKKKFLSRDDVDPHDTMLVNTLEAFLLCQSKALHNNDCVSEVHRVTFRDHIIEIERGAESKHHEEGHIDGKSMVWSLRRAFAILCESGLLFLEDEEDDRYLLLTFEGVLKPALLQLLRNRVHGISIAEVAEVTLTQQRFKRIPLEWLETSLKHLVHAQLAFQHENSQLLFIAPRYIPKLP